jgi:phosphatidylglycerol:prolipoprotein diacylglycerol transferase
MIWDFDPVAFSLFGLDIRWYGLVYAVGFVFAYIWGYRIHQSIVQKPLKKEDYQNIIFYAFVWGVIGGRIGHFLFYTPHVLWEDPFEIFQVWHGGMSIHGGIFGTVLYLWYAQKHYQRSFFALSDPLVLPLAIILIFGRIANFINGELVGKPTGTDWGVVFPYIDDQLRHPTQLYESGYGVLLSLILGMFLMFGNPSRRGLLTSVFLIGYGTFRFIVEFWKPIGWSFWNLNAGQWLCMVMILAGIFIVITHATKTKN